MSESSDSPKVSDADAGRAKRRKHRVIEFAPVGREGPGQAAHQPRSNRPHEDGSNPDNPVVLRLAAPAGDGILPEATTTSAVDLEEAAEALSAIKERLSQGVSDAVGADVVSGITTAMAAIDFAVRRLGQIPATSRGKLGEPEAHIQ